MLFVATVVVQCVHPKYVHKRGISADYLHEDTSSDMGHHSGL